MSYLNTLTDSQVPAINAYAAEQGIALDSYDWFIEAHQSQIEDDGTNAVFTLGELLELQEMRLTEGQTTINPSKVKSFFVKSANTFPVIAATVSKSGNLSGVINPLYEPIVVGSVIDSDLATIVSGGHRTSGILTYVDILSNGDTELFEMYKQETNVRVIHRKYRTREELAKAMLAANGSRTPVQTEKDVVKAIAKYGVNVHSIDDLREAIEEGKMRLQDWMYKLGSEGREFIHPTTGEQLKDLTLKQLFSKTYNKLIAKEFKIHVADANGEETPEVATTYKFIKDLFLSNKYSFRLTDEQFAIWQDYGDSWRFNDKTKQYDWVIPSKLYEMIGLMADELVSVLSTTDISNVAREVDTLAEYVANGVTAKVMDSEEYMMLAVPPKPPTAAKKARKVTQA